jgi:hypothetical protein
MAVFNSAQDNDDYSDLDESSITSSPRHYDNIFIDK